MNKKIDNRNIFMDFHDYETFAVESNREMRY